MNCDLWHSQIFASGSYFCVRLLKVKIQKKL